MNYPIQLRYLKYTPLFILFALAFMQSCKKDPSSLTKEELVDQLSKGKTYQEILTYAASIGIDSTRFTKKNDKLPIYEVMAEIAYGHKPELKYIQKIKSPDTLKLRAAAEDLVKGTSVSRVMEWLEPSYPDYQALRLQYVDLQSKGDQKMAAIVAQSLNAYRWMHRQSQGAPDFVMVNVRGAYLKGFDSTGNVALRMRTIVGKPSSPTPTMDTYATSLVTNPYWNVPKSIAIKEMIPKVAADEGYLLKNRIQVINKEGEVVDPSEINWNKIARKEDFPYRFRQETGEDNSLGLLKVEIKNPLAIYLHDTNTRYLFKGAERWRSHGCVRVEKPAELANFMAGYEMLKDDFFTEPDTISHPPKWNKLKTRIPVFLFDLGADIDENGKVIFFEEKYGLPAATS